MRGVLGQEARLKVRCDVWLGEREDLGAIQDYNIIQSNLDGKQKYIPSSALALLAMCTSHVTRRLLCDFHQTLLQESAQLTEDLHRISDRNENGCPDVVNVGRGAYRCHWRSQDFKMTRGGRGVCVKSSRGYRTGTG